MKSLPFFIFLILFLSCSKEIAKTSDFQIYSNILGKPRNKHLDSLDRNFIFAVGLKWQDVNFEGRHFQLPRTCDQKDLLNFFNQQKLDKDVDYDLENFAQQEKYEDIKNRKKQVMTRAEKIDLKDAPKVLQYSFLYFIDDYRVIFVSDNQVKYTGYNPVIKFSHLNVDLPKILHNKTIERGYYTYENGALVVELRQHLKEASKKLFFEFKNEDLILQKLITYTLKKDKNTGTTIQHQDLEIDLKKNLPDIIQLPVCFKVEKKPDLFLNNIAIDSSKYVLSAQQSQWIRRYYCKDTIIEEALDRKTCNSW